MLNALLQRCAVPDDDLPRVGVSACLLGRPVRYDGDHRQQALVAGTLARQVRLCEFCPEVGIGMPVPRPPIQVVRLGTGRRVRGVADRTRDVTDALAAYGRAVSAELDGFVFKARSPSCGLGTTPLMDADDRPVGLTDGEFARVLVQRFPHLPMVDENGLDSAQAVDAFVLRTWLYRAWRREPDPARVRAWDVALRSTPLAARVRPWLESLEHP